MQVKQEPSTAGYHSDDDSNEHHDDDDDYGAGDAGDPLSEMFEKCEANDDVTHNRQNAKLKKDFDNWFKNLVPGEKLSYNEWLWQLEFNFPSLDKLNFIKYGIILGMTILNKYYFDGSMKIDGNGIREVGAEFVRKRKKPAGAASSRPVAVGKVEVDESVDDDNCDFQHDEDHFSEEVDERDDDNEQAKDQPSTTTASTDPSTTNPINKSASNEPMQTTSEPINCKMCPESFPTHSQLYHHMCKNHTGHIGLNCPICNKRFQYERSMNLHIAAVHANNNDLPNATAELEAGRSICEICGASFDKISSLKSHSRYVHSIEKFYCQYCNRKLSSKKSLKEHIQFQHELTFVTHECEDCQRIFKYKSSYRLHMKKQHGIHFS